MMERRKSKRYPIILPALCWNQHRKDFYAVTQDISLDGIRMKSSILPSLDEELIVSIRQIGSVGAQVIRSNESSFVVRIVSRTRSVGAVARELVILSQLQDGRSQIRDSQFQSGARAFASAMAAPGLEAVR